MEKLIFYKKKILKILKKEKKSDKNELKKAIGKFDSFFSIGHVLTIEKSSYPVGTTREWKGKKFRKIAPGKWRRVYEHGNHPNSLKQIAHKIINAKDIDSLGKIIAENSMRFTLNSETAPILNEIKNLAKQKQSEFKKDSTSIKSEADKKLDAEYMDAIKNGDTEKIQKMVMDRAEKMGFKDAIPEQMAGCKLRVGKPPVKTKTIYKCFYVDTQGKPSALFIGNSESLPMNVWLDANDSYHFIDPSNGRAYVPSMGNPTNKAAGKTGDMRKFDAKTKAELVKRGYITEKANSVTALAYRPGWHGGDLPFFPQGGTKIKGQKTNYDNVHRWNQVIFEIEIDADTDYTEKAQEELKKKKAEGDRAAKADLQYMPEHGFYSFTTNPTVKQQTGGKGDWMISHSIKIKRALTEDECNKILAENGMKPQEWESMDGKGIGKMDLSKLGYTGESYDSARKTLAPITYNDDGSIIPLSERFNRNSDDVRKSFSNDIREILNKVIQ